MSPTPIKHQVGNTGFSGTHKEWAHPGTPSCRDSGSQTQPGLFSPPTEFVAVQGQLSFHFLVPKSWHRVHNSSSYGFLD